MTRPMVLALVAVLALSTGTLGAEPVDRDPYPPSGDEHPVVLEHRARAHLLDEPMPVPMAAVLIASSIAYVSTEAPSACARWRTLALAYWELMAAGLDQRWAGPQGDEFRRAASSARYLAASERCLKVPPSG